MRPQPPPFFPICPPAQAGTERLGLMVETASELVIEIGLGSSPIAERMVTDLLAGLRFAVPDLARERARGRVATHVMLDGLADKLEAAANQRAARPRHDSEHPPLPTETQLRVVIARMRLLARNT